MANKTYLDIIKASISDFNAIYGKLIDKKVVDSAGAALTTDSIVPTSTYDDLIDAQLYRVGNRKDKASAPKLSNGVIVDHAAKQITNYAVDDGLVENVLMAEPTLSTVSTAKARFNLGSIAHGYYDGNSISVDIPLKEYSLNSTNSGDIKLVENAYQVVGDTSGLMGAVNVAKGAVAVTLSNSKDKEDITDTLTVDTTKTQVALGETDSDSYALVIKKDIQYSGEVKVNSTVTVTEGYVKDGEITAPTDTISVKGSSNTTSETFRIKKGSIAVNDLGDAELSLTGTGIVLKDSLAENEEGYAIKGEAKDLQINGTITEGYVKSDTAISGTVGINGTKYIAKGSATVSDVTINADIDLGGMAASTDGTGYTVSLEGEQVVSTKVTEGYIKSTETDTAKASVTGSAIVKKGSVSGNITSAVSAESTVPNLISSSSTAYPITITNTLSGTTISTNEGYVKAADVKVSSTKAADSTIYVKAGGASFNAPTLDSKYICKDTAHADKTTGASLSLYESVSALEAALGTVAGKTDYYALVLNSSYSVTEGYQSSETKASTGSISDTGVVTSAAGSKVYYMPLATFEYVKSGEGDNPQKFIQAKTGGYVPSGALTDFSSITGQIDYASVTGKLTGVTFATGAEEGYTLTISKSSVDPGYISQGQGELKLDASSLKVKKGSVSGTSVVGKITQGTIKANEAGNGFIVPFTSTATSTITLGEGYVKPDDITVEGYEKTGDTYTKTIDNSGELTLDKSEVSASANVSAITVSEDATETTVETATSSNFFITTKYTGTAKAEATVGYVGEAFEFSKDISGKSSRIYIKAGSVGDLTVDNATGTVSAISSIAKSSDGKYSGKINITGIGVSSTIGEGYVAADTKTNNVDLTGKNVTINAGSVAGTINATYSLSSSDSSLVLVDSTSGSTSEKYIPITAGATNISVNATVTPGYISDSSEVTNSVGSAPEVTKYIKLVDYAQSNSEVTYHVNNDSTTEKTRKVYTAGTIGSLSKYVCDETGAAVAASSIAMTDDTSTTVQGLRDSVYINTAAQYAKTDIEVKLTDDAMGSSVVATLAALQSRMAGNYSATVGA